jgi:hypothetical protein
MHEKAAISISLLSPKANKRTVGLVGSALLLLLGGVFAFYSLSSLRNGASSLQWQRVQGQVISLQWHSPSDGPSFPSVRYRYTIGGEQYEGDNLCFGAASEASCKLSNLVAGGPVTVFVNPANPRGSVLLPGTAGFAKGFLGAGVLLATLGAFVAVAALRCHETRG